MSNVTNFELPRPEIPLPMKPQTNPPHPNPSPKGEGSFAQRDHGFRGAMRELRDRRNLTLTISPKGRANSGVRFTTLHAPGFAQLRVEELGSKGRIECDR